MIFSKDNDEMLLNLAVKNNTDMDRILSAYLVCGDQLFMLLHIFEGQDLHIPSKRKLNAANAHNIHFIEDDERKYADYEKYDSLKYDGQWYNVVAEERRILNHYYIPVIESGETSEEDEESDEDIEDGEFDGTDDNE